MYKNGILSSFCIVIGVLTVTVHHVDCATLNLNCTEEVNCCKCGFLTNLYEWILLSLFYIYFTIAVDTLQVEIKENQPMIRRKRFDGGRIISMIGNGLLVTGAGLAIFSAVVPNPITPLLIIPTLMVGGGYKGLEYLIKMDKNN